MHVIYRTANLIGAAALTVTGRPLPAAAEAGGISSSGAAALVTLVDEAGLGVTELGARIGLSQPAAARMIETLVRRGLMQRRAERDGRAVALHLTEAGANTAGDALRARGQELERLVGGLAPEERAGLTRGLEKLLDQLYTQIASEFVLCRLCDRGACRTAAHRARWARPPGRRGTDGA